jgi:hypothetical protein
MCRRLGERLKREFFGTHIAATPLGDAHSATQKLNQKRHAMTVRNYAITSSIIFFLVAILHLLRFIFQWNVMIGGWQVPMWASIVAVLVAGFLGFAGFRLFLAQRVSLFR